MLASHQHDKEAGMYLTLDTTAILVADRRSARELAASQRRSLAQAIRSATKVAAPAPALRPTTTGRTPVDAVRRAA